MRTKTLFILIALTIASCATAAPKELVDARAANLRANHGPAASVAPAEMHIADLALAAAEVSFKSDPSSYRAQDLAYVAERKAQLAEATASIINEKENRIRANDDYQNTQAGIVTDTRKSLNEANTALDKSDTALANSDAALAKSDAALAKSEKQTADALAALAKLAAVKEEARGLVITLSGSVLFASNQSVLLPDAQTRLNQVSEVLLSTKERNIIVEGHTDSEGSDSDNMNLSQRRADAVRDYLVSRGYEGDLVRAVGMGEGNAIADNNNAEGRANNRRVEIIIERDSTLSNR